MRLQIRGKNVEVSEAIRAYAEEKLGKLDRQLADPVRVELELTVEKNPSIAASHIAEATIWTKGPVLRARDSARDARASIDLLVDKLERQVTRYHEKRRRRGTRANGRRFQLSPVELPALPGAADDETSPIAKTKRFAVPSLDPEEAVLQLELVGHDFFVFRNEDSNDVNVVYRRHDGSYGLIEPE
jgi:putative sigma-54 modulation protein